MGRHLITPSLLNSWAYIHECRKHVREAEADEICVEDKRDIASQKAYDDFLSYLNREEREPTEAMLRGVQFEEDTLKGLTPASPYVEGGTYQLKGMREMRIGGEDYLLYGRLDWLKAGIIYDAKRVSRYEHAKYAKSHQHPFYLALWPNAKAFTYLIYDGESLHTETYYPDDCEDIATTINDFASWLKTNGLWETYENKWQAKGEN